MYTFAWIFWGLLAIVSLIALVAVVREGRAQWHAAHQPTHREG